MKEQRLARRKRSVGGRRFGSDVIVLEWLGFFQSLPVFSEWSVNASNTSGKRSQAKGFAWSANIFIFCFFLAKEAVCGI